MAGTQQIFLTDKDYEQIETMSGLGLPMTQISLILGINKRTLDRRVHDDERLEECLERGRAKATLKLFKTAYEMATSGKLPAMTIFYLKTQHRWSEETTQNIVISNSEVKGATDEQLLQALKMTKVVA